MDFINTRRIFIRKMIVAPAGTHHAHECGWSSILYPNCRKALGILHSATCMSVKNDLPDVYGDLCPIARKKLDKYAGAPARKRRGDPRRRYRHMGALKTHWGVESRRSWKLAIKALAIVGEQYAGFGLWTVLRSTCKELHACLRIHVAGIKYLTRVDFIVREVSFTCRHRGVYVGICERCARLGYNEILERRFQRNHIITHRMRNKYGIYPSETLDHMIGKLRLYAVLLIQRRWRTWRLVKQVFGDNRTHNRTDNRVVEVA